MLVGGDLPPNFPEDKFQDLLEKMGDKARQIGLYVNGAALNVDEEGEPLTGEKRHVLVMQFTVGDVAFSKRVQDPEEDQFDTEFKKFESGQVKDQVEDIRQRYLKGQADDGDQEEAG